MLLRYDCRNLEDLPFKHNKPRGINNGLSLKNPISNESVNPYSPLIGHPVHTLTISTLYLIQVRYPTCRTFSFSSSSSSSANRRTRGITRST